MNLDAIYYWCDNHTNMGANILTEYNSLLSNDGFIAASGYMQIQDTVTTAENGTDSFNYSTALLGTGVRLTRNSPSVGLHIKRRISIARPSSNLASLSSLL